MQPATPAWSERRRDITNRVAAALYGVIAILTAEPAIEPGEVSFVEAAVGVLLVGLVMVLTRFFVDLVKKETELGEHIGVSGAGALLRAASYAFAFPAPTAAVILIAAALGLRWRALIDLVAYLSIGAVFLLGFGSSYVLDDKPVPALLRAVTWTALGRVLFAAKKFL
jgi:hypothetical protein